MGNLWRLRRNHHLDGYVLKWNPTQVHCVQSSINRKGSRNFSWETNRHNYMRNKVPPRVTAGHTVFLKILLLIFVKKSRELRHTSFLDSKKFFFSILQSFGMSKASLCISSLKFKILMSVSLHKGLLFLWAKR